MRRVVAFAWILAGCGLSVIGAESVGGDAGAIADSGVATGSGDATNDAPGISKDDGGADAAPEVDTGPPCDPTPCPGKRCLTGGACDYYPDCKALDDERSPPSGIYTLRPSGASSTFDAYCEMEQAGGGWTLAGQSATSPNGGDFGFGSTLGDVKVETKAYALNALEKKLAIHEILVAAGTRANLRTAYVLKAPDGFPGAPFLDGGVAVPTVTKIANADCPKAADPENPSGPGMFQFIGFTLSTDGFYFRDNHDPGNFGLQRNRWQLNYETCNNAGLMNGQQGMVFVR